MKEGKVIVTGASRGIGRAITEKLLSEGYFVIGIAREFTDSIFKHPSFHPFSLDLSDLDLLSGELKKIIDLGPIQALIGCAGEGRFGSLEEFSLAQIRRIIDLNFLSNVYLARSLIPLFKRQGSGDMIFIGSEAALSGKKKGSIYSASKFALRGFVQALRDECSSDGVRISLINPGMVKTGFFDALSFRPGDENCEHILPQDVAGLVLLILSSRLGTVIDEINLSPQKRKIIFPKK